MDFGLVSLEGLVGSTSSDTKPATPNSFGSLASSSSSDPEAKQKWYGSGFKQERSGGSEDDGWRSSKLLKLPPPNGLSFTRAEAAKESQMLSFSCPKPEPFPVADRSPTLFPFFNLSSSDYYSTSNAGFASGRLNSGGTQLGVFTQSQWMELELQALIYKFITANIPIPSNLLLPIRKAVESARLSFFPSSCLPPNAFGLGAFHLGYSASSDPEPGRCRRTDGKKWRCSRDAVADGKYCERHVNRGRHRSRKHVEGQSGHSAAAPATTTENSNSSSSQASVVVGPQSSSAKNRLPITFQPISSSNLPQASSLSRQFMDDWTNKSQSDCSAVSWPQLDLQSDTHLSISIPLATADYMSSTSSPANNERPLLPLRLSRDVDPIQMGLGVSSSIADLTNQRQASWIPIPWGTSMGGPLGEVLNNTSSSNNSGECRNSFALNLMTEGWDTSPSMDSSPTGVLQKATFPSLSNSSAGSSPRADHIKTSGSASLCIDHGLVNPSAPSAF